MDIKIINRCQAGYKPNPEKIVRKILGRIPEKFLVGLGEIYLFDKREKQGPSVQCILKKRPSPLTVIEIYMDDPTFSGRPIFPIFCLNVDFIFGINKHIEYYLKPKSEDTEILSVNTKRINYDWMYVGLWSPVLALFKMVHFFMAKSRKLQRTIFFLIFRYVHNIKNRKK